jgi:hypothetical protein
MTVASRLPCSNHPQDIPQYVMEARDQGDRHSLARCLLFPVRRKGRSYKSLVFRQRVYRGTIFVVQLNV